ncbi:branched-chain amino acid ABC transporter permease [Candidatus Poribacteria bacterium]|nr:branched-chain amino acid ABC transporter permease [Candidatus Poribacteria bacterium]
MQFPTFQQLIQHIIYGITVGGIYALVAMGFTIIYNATDVINFAQGGFVMLGAMIMVSLNTTLNLPMPLAFFLSILIVTAIGIIFERAAINPVKNASVITLIIITVGASIFFSGIALPIWGQDPIYAKPFSSGDPVSFLGAKISLQQLWVLGITAVIVVAVQLFYKYTIIGKAMRATAINRTAARLMGINVRLMVLCSFALSAAVGAGAGMAIAPVAHASYDMGSMLGLKGFCAAVLGGLGNGVGAVVGGFTIGIIERLAIGFAPLGYSGYKDAVAFIILLVILFLKPSGLFGTSQK